MDLQSTELYQKRIFLSKTPPFVTGILEGISSQDLLPSLWLHLDILNAFDRGLESYVLAAV